MAMAEQSAASLEVSTYIEKCAMRIGVTAEELKRSRSALLLYADLMEPDDLSNLIQISETFAVAGCVKRAAMAELRGEIEKIENGEGVA